MYERVVNCSKICKTRFDIFLELYFKTDGKNTYRR